MAAGVGPHDFNELTRLSLVLPIRAEERNTPPDNFVLNRLLTTPLGSTAKLSIWIAYPRFTRLLVPFIS